MIRLFLRQLVSFIFLWLPLLILFWAVWLRAHSTPRICTPAWRSYLAFAATAFVSLSVLLWVVSLLWARVIGGFPFYDPALLRFYRWGFLTSLAGLLTSVVGKGKRRWPSCGLSALMAFLWFAAALGE
jgi:hypothetical protein